MIFQVLARFRKDKEVNISIFKFCLLSLRSFCAFTLWTWLLLSWAVSTKKTTRLKTNLILNPILDSSSTLGGMTHLSRSIQTCTLATSSPPSSKKTKTNIKKRWTPLKKPSMATNQSTIEKWIICSNSFRRWIPRLELLSWESRRTVYDEEMESWDEIKMKYRLNW